ncbi:MAG: amino acid-binding protein [Desulfovibrio sp.]|nr:amino acid-binding protein [Desulfovibrio sp.]
MKAEQLSVFLENRSGSLSRVIDVLAREKIRILAMSLADTSDFGILRMITRDMPKTRAVLAAEGFTIGSVSVIAARVGDSPEKIGEFLRLLANRGVNVEYMYAFIRDDSGETAMIFRFDKMDEAIELLREKEFDLMTARELSDF